MSKVLVSGASGFLALHIIGELLQKGYSVIGTVRSQAKADKLTKQFNEKFDDPKLEFAIVPDILESGAFDKVFKENKDIKFALHTASPFSFGSEGSNEELYRDPAVNGTLNVLESIKEFASQIGKVVITSSFASINNGDKNADKSFIHDESVWNPMTWDDVTDQTTAYVVSKKLAETAAWDFVKTNDVSFSLNTICPPFIFGPQFFDDDVSLDGLNASSSIIANLLKSDPKDTSLFDGTALLSVDVRDVAAFHELALKDSIKGERLFPVKSRFSEQGILDILNKDFPQLQGKIAKGQPEGETSIPTPALNNDKSVKLVGGFEFIPLEKQVGDTVDQILIQTNFLS